MLGEKQDISNFIHRILLLSWIEKFAEDGFPHYNHQETPDDLKFLSFIEVMGQQRRNICLSE